jgi:hypothetical protein
MGRRPYGTGSVYEQGASWYGRWYQNGKRVKRKIGPIRQPGSRDGLTENMAGKRLQRMMLEADALRWQDVDWPAAASGSGVTTCVVSGAGQRHVAAAAASRSPTASPGSWSATTSAATTGPTRISSSATRSAGRSWITASS